MLRLLIFFAYNKKREDYFERAVSSVFIVLIERKTELQFAS